MKVRLMLAGGAAAAFCLFPAGAAHATGQNNGVCPDAPYGSAGSSGTSAGPAYVDPDNGVAQVGGSDSNTGLNGYVYVDATGAHACGGNSSAGAGYQVDVSPPSAS